MSAWAVPEKFGFPPSMTIFAGARWNNWKTANHRSEKDHSVTRSTTFAGPLKYSRPRGKVWVKVWVKAWTKPGSGAKIGRQGWETTRPEDGVRARLRIYLLSILAAFLVVSVEPPAKAAVVFLKSGRTVEGEITFRDAKRTFINLRIGGELILNNEEIVSIENNKKHKKRSQLPGYRAVEPALTATPADNSIVILDSLLHATSTPTPIPPPKRTPTPRRLREIKPRRFEKQEHRTLLARRYVYHIVVEEQLDEWETRIFLMKQMNFCRKDAKYFDAIEIRLYGIDEKGQEYKWPFAGATFAPEGEYEKGEANIPRDCYMLKIKIQDKVEYYKSNGGS